MVPPLFFLVRRQISKGRDFAEMQKLGGSFASVQMRFALWRVDAVSLWIKRETSGKATIHWLKDSQFSLFVFLMFLAWLRN